MGLDMYFRAEVTGAFAEIDAALTARDRLDLSEDGLYVSSWRHQEEPDALWAPLVAATGFTPTSDSPSFDVRAADGGGYRILATMIYWRKANQIHEWFVRHVQGGVDECQEAPVHPESLMDLLDRCQQISADHDLAPILLPSASGYFFGNTGYDEYYFADLKRTVTEIRAVVTAVPVGTKFSYQSSW